MFLSSYLWSKAVNPKGPYLVASFLKSSKYSKRAEAQILGTHGNWSISFTVYGGDCEHHTRDDHTDKSRNNLLSEVYFPSIFRIVNKTKQLQFSLLL